MKSDLHNIAGFAFNGVMTSTSETGTSATSTALTKEPSEIIAAFEQLDAAAVSDALDAHSLPTGQGCFRPISGQLQAIGFAKTVQLGPYQPDGANAHIASTTVSTSGSDDLIVVVNEGRTDVSCWGGLLSLGASLNGVRGVVADGVCRDVSEARELGFPVFAKGSIPATARGRLRQISAGEPVAVGEVTVHPGDLVFADETGLAVIPREQVEIILETATAIAAREAAIAEELRRGVPIDEAMLDSKLLGSETSR